MASNKSLPVSSLVLSINTGPCAEQANAGASLVLSFAKQIASSSLSRLAWSVQSVPSGISKLLLSLHPILG